MDLRGYAEVSAVVFGSLILMFAAALAGVGLIAALQHALGGLA